MAGTRRTVERLVALLISVIITVLMFRPLMMGKNIFGGFHGDGTDPATIAVLVLNGRNDSLDTEKLSVPMAPVIDAQKVDNTLLTGESPDPFISHPDTEPGGAYLPVSMLTQRPIVLVDIHPELPGSLQGVEPQFIDLLLLINAFGDVDQVRLESVSTLSTSMVQELQQHFQVMRFMPGQWRGQAVPSALHIRVQLYP